MPNRRREDRATRKRSEARAEELRTKLLEQASESRQSKEGQQAITYCEMCITEYEWWFDWNEKRWIAWQRVTIFGGVIATLAGVITIPDNWMMWAPAGWQSLSWLRGVPAAIVTIAASFLGSFNYREDAVRHEMTVNALWNELAKYQVHAEPYNVNEAKDTSLFTNTVCRIVDAEVRNWSALVNGLHADAENGDDPPRNKHLRDRELLPTTPPISGGA